MTTTDPFRSDISINDKKNIFCVQSGASSLAKQGGAYFSAVYRSIEDPMLAPRLYDIQVA